MHRLEALQLVQTRKSMCIKVPEIFVFFDALEMR